MKNNILVLGYFGYITNQLDGQTVKTRNVYSLLASKGEQIGEIAYFDTQQFQNDKLSVFTMLWKLINSKKLVYLPAHNNLKYIFPFLFLICKLFNIEILYIVVGGWLFEYLQNKPIHRYLLKKISGIFPQSNLLVEKLRNHYGFENVKYFPNYRIHSFKPEFINSKDTFKIVFMARVTKLKGVDTVFRLAKYIEHKYKEDNRISINFYGPIPKNEKVQFFQKLKQHSNTQYNGIIEPQNVYSVLNQYDLLVFPTRYPGEGFPGTLLDSYIAGIPVIASNWRYIPEFVDTGKTGFLFDVEKEKDFFQYVNVFYNNRKLLFRMKKNAYEKSKEYCAEVAWAIIKKFLKKELKPNLH